jgi:hypothetical protein
MLTNERPGSRSGRAAKNNAGKHPNGRSSIWQLERGRQIRLPQGHVFSHKLPSFLFPLLFSHALHFIFLTPNHPFTTYYSFSTAPHRLSSKIKLQAVVTMLGLTSRLLFRLSLVVALFSALSLALTVPILGLGADPPPSFLLTTDISPQCVNTNNGTYLCCASAVQGGDPLVVALSTAADYQLPANTVNGLECKSLLHLCLHCRRGEWLIIVLLCDE